MLDDEMSDRRENKLRLEKSINVGQILTIVIIIFSLIQMYGGIMARMTTMENKVDMMWSQFQFSLKK